MVGEHVGQVLGPLAGLALEPGGGGAVAGGAGGAGDLPVADVPDQQVPEAVLGLALHRARAGRADELLAGELVQRQLDLARVAVSHLRHGARPEELAHDGGVLQQALALRRERVQARGDQRLHRVGQLDIVEASGEEVAVGEQAHELLRVQGVAARPLEQRLLRLCRQDRPLEERGDQPRRLLVGQRSEVDRGRVAQAGCPGRMLLVQLGAGRAEDEQRHALRPVGQVLEEGEQGVVCPVQVLEDEHGRALCGQRFQEAPPGRERLLLGGGLRRRADERGEAGLEPDAVLLVGGQGALELGLGLVGRVGLEDAALGLDDLPERPEGDPLPVGKAAALPPVDEVRGARRCTAKSSAQRRLLPTPGSPTIVTSWQERCCAERSNVPISSGFSSSRPTSGVVCVRVTSEPKRARAASGRKRASGSALPFTVHGLELLVVEDALRLAVGLLRDRDPVHRRRPLQAGSGVDDVARDDPLALFGAGAQARRPPRRC